MPPAELEPVADLRLEATLVQQAEGMAAASEQDGRPCKIGPARSVLAERALEPADALGRVGCCRGRGQAVGGSCVSARSGRPRRAPRRCLGRGSAPPSATTRAARRGTARPRRFGRVIDRPCRADRVGFGAGLTAVHAFLERGRSTRRRTRADHRRATGRDPFRGRQPPRARHRSRSRSGSVASVRAGVRRRADHRARRAQRLGARGWSGVGRRADRPSPRTADHRVHAGADQPTRQPGLP